MVISCPVLAQLVFPSRMSLINDDEEDVIIGAAATSVLAAGVAFVVAYENSNSIPRAPYSNKDQEREFYMNSILNGSTIHCVGQIRMSQPVFLELCNALRRNNFLSPTKNMSVQEQLLIFLEIVGFNERFRKIGSHFYRSIESIHRCFHTVLKAILKLYPFLVKSPDGTVQQEIRNNQRYFPWFSDCVGAIDGTHVLASVPVEQQSRFRGRKGTTTQNVLAAVSFNLKFTYVLAGWEGSAHDSHVLNDALERPRGFQVPQGKYYLVDAGYGIRKGFLPPYHGVRYHLQEYSDRPPQNEKELFNLRHASLRSTVERAFAILKRRFRVVDNEPFWDFKTQVDVVLACCILYNHIIELEPNDLIVQEVDGGPPTQDQNGQVTQNSQGSQSYQTPRERREEARQWSLKRDAIAHAMFTNYDRRNR